VIQPDIKSSDIFLTLDYDIKILSFPVSKILESTLKGASSFEDAMFYVSSEFFSDGHYSYASDIWSLGIILYELMTFDVPFKKSLTPFAEIIKTANLPPINQPYSSELKHLASSMLKKDPLERISASDILKINFIRNISPIRTSKIESSSQIEEMLIPEEYFKLGTEALSEEKFTEAEDFLVLAIKGGFIEAVNEYSKYVNDGKFTSLRKFELERYFLLAIENGDIESLNFYGYLLRYSVYGKGKIPLSEEYFLRAIEKGFVPALNNYACALANGIYGKEKIPLSEEYFLKAIEKGEVNASNNSSVISIDYNQSI
jgi:serine/threonine protein kinase